MSDAATTERFRLTFPAEPMHVSTARIFVGAVARSLGADEDTVEEVKVGISEACSMTLRASPDQEDVSITVAPEDGRLTFSVEGRVDPGWVDRDLAADTPTPTSIASVLSREVLAALFDDAHVDNAGERGNIRFSIALPAQD